MKAEKKILVVEDDPTLLEVLRYNLSKEGYIVSTATDGAQALEIARNIKPELITLDLMLPKVSGFEVCRILRHEMAVLIIVLTAKDDEIDKVIGLDLGADDYLTKPFQMRELLARIRALFRRSEMAVTQHNNHENIIKAGEIQINIARHQVWLKNVLLDLTPKEFDFLTFLAQNKGVVFNREQILEKVWGYDFPGDTRTVDVHIRWLRAKIEDDSENPRYLITIRNIGYKMEE